MQAIQTTALVKRYKNLTAVDRLDLEIQQGELFSLLGVNGGVIKAHGSSNARAIRSAVMQAINIVENDISGKIEANIEYMKLKTE